jgi:hypothetical protein
VLLGKRKVLFAAVYLPRNESCNARRFSLGGGGGSHKHSTRGKSKKASISL